MDVKFVLFGVLVIISILQYLIQAQRYKQIINYLSVAAIQGWTVKQGGTSKVLYLHA